MKKHILIFTLLISVALNCFASDWYVCVGSFKNPENSQKRCAEFSAQNIQTFAGEEKLESGEVLYRVFIDQAFPDKVSARNFRDSLAKNDAVSGIEKTNFWISQFNGHKIIFINSTTENIKEVVREVIKEVEVPVERIVEKEVIKEVIKEVEVPVEKIVEVVKEVPVEVIKEVPVEPEANVLLKNEDLSSAEISEETPYSVLVRSYKEEQKALADQKRLEEKDIETYLVKEYDDQTLFTFDLHSGAFASEEDAQAFVTELEEKGITETKVSNINDIQDKIDKYDEVVSSTAVTYNSGKEEYPDTLTQPVVDLLNAFPVNEDFQLEEFIITDLDNMRKYLDSVTYSDISSLLSQSPETIHSECNASYKDTLYNGSAEIYTAIGDKNTFISFDNISGIDFPLNYMDRELNCKIDFRDGDYLICGVSENRDFVISIALYDFEGDALENYLKKIQSDNDLTAYTQLKKTLFVLPDINEDINRNFVQYSLNRVPESYIEEKHNVPWSYGFVNHYRASASYFEDDKEISVSLFDMEYNYSAEAQHSIVVKDRTYGHQVQTKNTDAWISPVIDSKKRNAEELSLVHNSNIISVSTYELSEEQLIDFVDNLQIWDEN